jgi:hypothetical protein
MTNGIMTDAQRDHLLVKQQVESDVLEAIAVFLLIHLARKEADPMSFLRELSEDLHDIANHVSVDPTQEFAVRYLEAHRTKVDELIQAAAHRLGGSN